ncbi:MAG: 2-oxoacid:acceptor oxidoreductase family protein [Clostridiales bacterium]
MAENLVKIVLAGEGGQGVQSVANIITEAAYARGKQALYIPNFGVEQRGGVSVAFVQIAEDAISSLKFAKADVVVALSPRAMLRTEQYVNEDTIYIYDSSLDKNMVPGIAKHILPIPAMEIVTRDFHPRVFNVLVMGAVVGVIPMIEMTDVADALVKKLQYKFDKEPALKKMNLDVLEIGANYFAANK